MLRLLVVIFTAVAQFVLLLSAAAQTPSGQPALPSVQLQTGLYLIKAEVANEYGTRMQGLMLREKMAPNEIGRASCRERV